MTRALGPLLWGFGFASLGTGLAQPGDRVSGVASETLRLQELIPELLANNPEIQAARKRYEASEVRPGRESALPDPKIGVGWASAGAPLPGFGLGTEPMANLGLEISQEFPFPGKRRLRGTLAAREAESDGQRFRLTELAQVARLKSAYHELRFVYDAIDVLGRNADLLQRLARVAEARYSAGRGNQQDLVRSEVEINLLEVRVLQLRQRVSSLEAEINGLLNRPVGWPLGRPEPIRQVPPLPPLDSLQQLALEQSPMLRSQRAVVDSMQIGVDLARMEYYPDFEIIAGYFNQGSMKDMWEFRMRLNVPVFFWGKQRLGLEEAGSRLSESQRSFRALEQELGVRIRDRHAAAETSERLMDLYARTVTPKAALALESSLASYETGSVDFLSVLANLTSILESEFGFQEQQAAYLQALARLDELIGKPPMDG